MPSHCPVCGSDVIRLDSEAAQIKESLKYFASRNGMDIKGLGDSLTGKLVESGKVRTLTDVYNLELRDLLSLDKVQDKTARNIMAEIEKSKQRPLENILTDIGIRGCWLRASEEAIASIEGVGSVITRSVCQFFETNQALISRLKELGFNLTSATVMSDKTDEAEAVNHFFAGKTFVFTRTLSSMTREKASS